MRDFVQVGLIAGNIKFVRELFDEFNKTFGFIIDFGMLCYMFALGIEMDPYVLLERPTRHAKVAYAGVISTFILSILVTPLLKYFPNHHKALELTSVLSVLLASTNSPVLTRLITQVKIGKSDIGKLVIAAGMHSDFVCSLILCFGYLFIPLPEVCDDLKQELKVDNKMVSAVLGQMLVTAIVSPFFMNWVDNENPEGRPMKGSHLVLSIAFMVLMCATSTMKNYSPILSAFLVGICFPRDSRVSKWVITKINYMLNTIFFPIFFLWMGFEADFRQFQMDDPGTWTKLLLLMVVSIFGKVLGTLVSGAMLGFHWPESVAIGLLLTTKGYFHIYIAIKVVILYPHVFFILIFYHTFLD